MASVTYDHVTKKFGEMVAVDNLDIKVDDKEFLVLVGPSGCGKTTALRCLAAWRTLSESAGRRHCPTPELSCREALCLPLPRAPRYVLTGRALMPEQAS